MGLVMEVGLVGGGWMEEQRICAISHSTTDTAIHPMFVGQLSAVKRGVEVEATALALPKKIRKPAEGQEKK